MRIKFDRRRPECRLQPRPPLQSERIAGRRCAPAPPKRAPEGARVAQRRRRGRLRRSLGEAGKGVLGRRAAARQRSQLGERALPVGLRRGRRPPPRERHAGRWRLLPLPLEPRAPGAAGGGDGAARDVFGVPGRRREGGAGVGLPHQAGGWRRPGGDQAVGWWPGSGRAPCPGGLQPGDRAAGRLRRTRMRPTASSRPSARLEFAVDYHGEDLVNDHLEWSEEHRCWACKHCNERSIAAADLVYDDESRQQCRRPRTTTRPFASAY